MRIILHDIDLNEFTPWCGAVSTVETIQNADKVEEFNSLINELYPDGLEDVTLNDLLWFEREWLYECLGIKEGV